MWPRKQSESSNRGKSNNTSIHRPFTIKGKAGATKQTSNERRSRDPSQGMNLSAFLRSVIASSKEDLAAEGQEEGDDIEQDSASNSIGGRSDEDDNLHELMATIDDVNSVCDMLERCANVSSSEDDTRRRKEGLAELEGLSSSLYQTRRKARKTEVTENFPRSDTNNDEEGYELDSYVEEHHQSEPHSPPTLILQVSTHSLGPGRRARLKTSSASEDDTLASSTSAILSRHRRREAQRSLLRRSLSGRLTRKSSAESLVTPLVLLPHARTTAVKHKKRGRSACKKELPETPRSHTEDVVIRKALGSVHRKYLIPRMRRLQHFNLHVVIDLDETLVSARNGPILVRPYVGHLIQTLMDCRCEIILWTAGIPQYVAGIITGLTMAIQGLSAEVSEQTHPPWLHHLIQRNDRWYDEEKVCVKNLKLLGRPLERVLVIENNPAAVQMQVSNAILVQDYVVENYNDRSLEVVARVASRCARSIEPVEVSLAADPELLLVEFDLAGEHSIDGKPIRPVEYGLKYSPPGTRVREHAGESPCAIIEKE